MIKKTHVFVLLIALYLVGVTTAFAQQNNLLSTDPTVFMTDLEKLLNTVEEKKRTKEIIADLTAVFQDKFGEAYKKESITLTNGLLAKNINLKKDLVNLIESYVYFGKSPSFTKERLGQWMVINKDLISEKNPRKFNEFIEFSKDLFQNNIVYNSAGTEWKIIGKDYTFILDKIPYVSFTSVDLICTSKNDSSIIYQTNGIFNTSTFQWIGDKGTVTWERVKLDKKVTYAELKGYKISLRSTGFMADSVIFHHPYFSTPIEGNLREKVVTLTDYKKAKYPYFSSYNQRLTIKDIFENIDYEGGFRMEGLQLNGGGEGTYRGSVTVKKDGKAFLIAEAKNIEIDPDGISATDSRATVYIYGGEIISHPSCNFIFNKEKKEYGFVRVGNGNTSSPFESTFHQLDMHFETLNWKEGDPVITFGALRGSIERKATFESRDFFSIENYNEFQNSQSNLLYDLYKYHKNNNEIKEIPLIDFANYLRLTLDQLESSLIKMNNIGVIYYVKETQTIFIKDRLEKYIKSRSQTGDYDNLQIESEVTEGYNATVNLANNNLIIKGIKGFPIARRKNVKIFPKEGTILMKKNRDINFSGVINAGRAEFFADNMDFLYNDFKVNLPLVDSLRFRVNPIDNSVGQQQVRLLSCIESLQGTLYIDDPKNKSGNDTNRLNYPKVDITNETYVYYDKGMAFGRKYDRNDFKFKVKPFKKDSLAFFSTDGLVFPGTFTSAGIFPPLDQKLSVQPDYSLGFLIENITKKIYDGRADYSNQLALNNKGLQGKGGLSYLTSEAQSDDIVFFPDSLIAEAQTYFNKGQSIIPNVPQLRAKDIFIMYQPKKGIWTAETKDSLIEIFEDDITRLKGKIRLTNASMTGEGTLSFNQIEVLSYSFKLKERTIDADTCEFIVKGQDPLDPLSFQAINMRMHIDFDSRIGDFESNDGNSYLEFPDNQFICYMDKFQWFMDSDQMGMANDEDSSGFNINSDMEILEPNFFSTRPDQDSLSFASNSARYDMKKKELTCENIKFIPIADAKIYPDSGLLVIRKKAKYQPLEHAVIVANSVTKFHEFKDASVQLISKKKYEASGIYTAIKDSSVNSKIKFTKIEPNEEQITMAEGSVGENENFNISPEFKFYGKAFINASEMGVTYEGKTSIVHDCRGLESGWITFNSKVDTSNILIPLGEDFDEFTSGLMTYTGDSIGFYTSFLARKQNKSDYAMTPAKGWLAFDRTTKEFKIGNLEKLQEKLKPGNVVSLNTQNCTLFADGLIDFANNLGQLKLEPIGQLYYDTLKEVKLSINASISFNFPFDENSLKIMGENLNQIQEENPFEIGTSTYDMIIKNKLVQKKADKAISDLNLYGKLEKLPKELINNFTILDMKIVWNEEKQAYFSKGEYGIANVGEIQVFKKMKVWMMLEKNKNGDILHLNLEAPDGTFYYFNYKRGVFQTVAFNSSYNDAVTSVKPKKATFKGSKAESDFQFMTCSKAKRLLFMENFPVEEETKEEEQTEDPFKTEEPKKEDTKENKEDDNW